jgi:membrane associated rhomboid family serine protease
MMAIVTDAKPTDRDRRTTGFELVAVMVALMWIVEVVDTIDHHRLDRHAIEPHDPDGLIGVVTAPFLHASFGHLIGNTVPFVVLGALIAFAGAARVLVVTALVALISGLGTWLVAPAGTLHLGASGVVFGYATYLIARGVFDGSVLHIAVAVGVAAIFGGALLGGLQPQQGISWQGHLFGALGGLVAARVLARPVADGRGERARPPRAA